MSEPETSQLTPHVFISYLREDAASVQALCEGLKGYGVRVWLDREMIRPGERWQSAIRNAIEQGAFFLACFSSSWDTRHRTYMNVELALAIDELRHRPAHRAWFIPILFDGGYIPDRPIGGGETLRDIQWVDMASDWRTGFARLVQTLLPDAVASETPLQQSANAVLVADLTGVTQYASGEDVMSALLEILNSWQAITDETVQTHNGESTAFSGDTVMAVFNSCASAVGCAIDIRNRVQVAMSKYAGLDLSIGIAEGPVLVGRVGGRTGVVGMPANLASRLCSLAQPGQIVVTDAIANEAPQFCFKHLAQVPLKGADHAVSVMEVVHPPSG